MKKITVILISIILLYGYGMSKAKMAPEMLEKINQKLEGFTHGVMLMGDIPASPRLFCWIYSKDIGKKQLLFKQRMGMENQDTCDTVINADELVVIKEIVPKKWGFRFKIYTANTVKYTATQTYTQRYRINDVVSEVEKTRNVVADGYNNTQIDFMFDKSREADTPENIQFVLDTFAKVFKFFKSRTDALLYIDQEINDCHIEVGMTADEVVKKVGKPKSQDQSESEMTYTYDLWEIRFQDNKVVDVTF